MVRLNPVHKFSILCLSCILLLVLVLSFVVSHYFKRIMLERELRITADFVQAHSKERLTPQDFSSSPTEAHVERFKGVFQEIAKMPEVVGIKVYDSRATILWSDRKELIGQRFPENKELQEVMNNGSPVVVLEPIRRPDHIHLKKYQKELLEVYVPISFGGNPASGAVATYKASHAVLEAIRAGKMVIWLVSIAGGIILYVFLFGAFWRAYKTEERMTEGINRLNQELLAFNSIAISLNKHLELNTLLKEALDKTLEVLEIKAGWVLLLDEEKKELILAVHKGLPDSMVHSFKAVKVGEDIPGEVLVMGKPMMRARFSETPEISEVIQPGMGMKSCVSIPLKSTERVLGVIEIMCAGCAGCDCKLPLESYEFFSAIGHHIGTAIAKSMLYREVKTFKERLEEMVEEKTRQIIQMDKLSTLGALIGEIAHQINNPLVGVVNFAQLALKKMNKDHPMREEIETIKRAGMECKEIIQRLLTFSRQPSFEKASTDVNHLIDEGLALTEKQFDLNRITIVKNYGDLSPIMMDATLMRQALFNIINNARESMTDGGRLTITTSTVNTIPKGDWVEIDISDTGIGIKEENLQKVFSPFFTTKSDGVGLGLAIAQDIIHRHQGEVMVKSSRVGVGTTFTIRLPVGQAG